MPAIKANITGQTAQHASHIATHNRSTGQPALCHCNEIATAWIIMADNEITTRANTSSHHHAPAQRPRQSHTQPHLCCLLNRCEVPGKGGRTGCRHRSRCSSCTHRGAAPPCSTGNHRPQPWLAKTLRAQAEQPLLAATPTGSPPPPNLCAQCKSPLTSRRKLEQVEVERPPSFASTAESELKNTTYISPADCLVKFHHKFVSI